MGDVWKWVGELSRDFMTLLRGHHPPALVVLAHFSILGWFCENRWFYRGWTANAVEAIKDTLDDKWNVWLSWPEHQLTAFRANLGLPVSTIA
jgi:hypothetical protein